MDTPAIIGTTLLAVGVGALIFLRLNRDEQFGDEFSDPYGDVSSLHREMRLPGSPGEGPSLAGKPLTGLVAHHDKGASRP